MQTVSKHTFSWDRFYKIPLVGILRGFAPEQVRTLAKICADGGLPSLEITMNSPCVCELISELAEQYGSSLNIGAGTVCNLDELELALGAGASFIITPYLNVEVIRECKNRGIPIFPGAFTPTEIYLAWDAGADIVKVFPASSVGPGYLKDLSGPFPQIKLMPTGGVTPETIGAFKAAGAVAFSVGSSLFDKRRIDAGEYDWVSDQLARFTAAL